MGKKRPFDKPWSIFPQYCPGIARQYWIIKEAVEAHGIPVKHGMK
jgi:hypothetical protein